MHVSNVEIILGNDSQGNAVILNNDARLRHLYLLARAGCGKTTLLENLIVQDIKNGNGVFYIDFSGESIQRIISNVQPDRQEDVVVISALDPANHLAINPLAYDRAYPEQRGMAARETYEVLRIVSALDSTGGPKLEQYLSNAMRIVMQSNENSTLKEVQLFMRDKNFRNKMIAKSTDVEDVNFWTLLSETAGSEADFQIMADRFDSAIAPVVSDPVLSKIIFGSSKSLKLRDLIDSKKIILVDLPIHQLGSRQAGVLASLIFSRAIVAAFSRQDQPTEQRLPLYVYLDELQHYSPRMLMLALSEMRKYAVSITMANQYLEQLDEQLKDEILNSAETIIAGTLGITDATELMELFGVNDPQLLMDRKNHHFMLSMFTDGNKIASSDLISFPPIKDLRMLNI